MNTHAWFTVSEINAWADEYHLKAIKQKLKSVQMSGEPAEIGQVYIGYLAGGLDQFKELVNQHGLTCKFVQNTGRYYVERPGRAFK